MTLVAYGLIFVCFYNVDYFFSLYSFQEKATNKVSNRLSCVKWQMGAVVREGHFLVTAGLTNS